MAFEKINRGEYADGPSDGGREGALKINNNFDEVEQRFTGLSSEESGKTYDTLTAAQALTPKPVNGTAFQVSKVTDASHAGYYTFQSGSSGGTRFEKPFINPVDVVEKDNEQPATSNAVYDATVIPDFGEIVHADSHFDAASTSSGSTNLGQFTARNGATLVKNSDSITLTRTTASASGLWDQDFFIGYAPGTAVHITVEARLISGNAAWGIFLNQGYVAGENSRILKMNLTSGWVTYASDALLVGSANPGDQRISIQNQINDNMASVAEFRNLSVEVYGAGGQTLVAAVPVMQAEVEQHTEVIGNLKDYTAFYIKTLNPGVMSILLKGNDLDLNKQYYVSYFRKNYSPGGGLYYDYFTINYVGYTGSGGGTATAGVCRYRPFTNYPTGIGLLELEKQGAEDIYGYALVNWDDMENITASNYETNGIYTGNTYNKDIKGLKAVLPAAPELAVDRFVMGTKLYALQGRKTLLFKQSIISNQKASSADTLMAIGVSADDEKDCYFKASNSKMLELVDDELPGTIKLAHSWAPDAGRLTLYGDDITVNYTTKAAVVGKTAMYNPMGDSITDYRLVWHLDQINSVYAAAVTFIGSRNDTNKAGVNVANDGRASWGYMMIVGMKNDRHGTAIVPWVTGLNPGDLLVNPFIRIATSQDKIDFPTWCFENTPATTGLAKGSEAIELNYTQSQAVGTYAGQYYIFDYSAYLTRISKTPAGKFIITNALGFNDIDYGLIDYNGTVYPSYSDKNLEYLNFCMNIFLRRTCTHLATLSGVTWSIGIAPLIAFSAMRNWPVACKHMEATMKLIAQLVTAYSWNIDYLNTISGFSTEHSWTYNTITNLSASVSTDNASKIFNTSDDRHPTQEALMAANPNTVGGKLMASQFLKYLAFKIK